MFLYFDRILQFPYCMAVICTLVVHMNRCVYIRCILGLSVSLQLDVFDAAERYQQAGLPLMILAGKEYGSGSSRDWAAKGPFLLVCLSSYHNCVLICYLLYIITLSFFT